MIIKTGTTVTLSEKSLKEALRTAIPSLPNMFVLEFDIVRKSVQLTWTSMGGKDIPRP